MFSPRAAKLLGKPSPIAEAHVRCAADPYTPANPQGFLNLGTAENRLLWEWLAEKLPRCYGVDEEDTHYQPHHGMRALREAMASYLARTFRGTVTAREVLIGSGATAILDMLAFALAEPGEAFLVPAPYYPGFSVDLAGRSDVRVVAAPMKSADGYRLTRECLEAGVASARAQGIALRGLLLSSPNNPLGTVLSAEEVRLAIEFSREHRWPVIFDEVYGASVHSGKPFESALYWRERYPDYRENVYLIYSLSKDFSLSGYRIGVFSCADPELMAVMTKIVAFGMIPADTQRAMARLLDDASWVTLFQNENRRRLRVASQHWKKEWESRTGLPLLEAEAGFFAWLDLRTALARPDFASEQALFEKMMAARVSILPGHAFGSEEPGWFRACIAHPNQLLTLAAERLVAVVRA